MDCQRVYAIEEQVFERFPGFVRGVVVAHAVKNGPSPQALIAELRAAEEALRVRLKLETLLENPRIAAWREAYRAFGAKPSEFRPSMEAMARRILHGQEIPSINALVDIGNVISLQHLVPVGGHAIDLLGGDIALRFATGQETFVPFGSQESEHPEPGEIIFTEGDTVLTRRWTWRQGNHTLTLPETTAIEFNVDGLPPVTVAEVEEINARVSEMVQNYCGGILRAEILSAEHPSLCLD